MHLSHEGTSVILLLLATAAAATDLQPGVYALAMRIATIAEAAWLPSQRSISTSRVLLDLRQVDGRWVQTARVCAVDIAGNRLARITVPARFIAAMPTRRSYPTIGAGRFEADMGLDAVGFEGEALPALGGEVLDWDADGHPGATVWVKVPVLGSGEVYIAQAAWLLLDGDIKDGGAEGRLRVRRFEQRTYGADPDWLALDTRLTADESKSTFVLRPLAADATCDDVVEATRHAH